MLQSTSLGVCTMSIDAIANQRAVARLHHYACAYTSQPSTVHPPSHYSVFVAQLAMLWGCILLTWKLCYADVCRVALHDGSISLSDSGHAGLKG